MKDFLLGDHSFANVGPLYIEPCKIAPQSMPSHPHVPCLPFKEVPSLTGAGAPATENCGKRRIHETFLSLPRAAVIAFPYRVQERGAAKLRGNES